MPAARLLFAPMLSAWKILPQKLSQAHKVSVMLWVDSTQKLNAPINSAIATLLNRIKSLAAPIAVKPQAKFI
jgi:hypothetical protein